MHGVRRAPLFATNPFVAKPHLMPAPPTPNTDCEMSRLARTPRESDLKSFGTDGFGTGGDKSRSVSTLRHRSESYRRHFVMIIMRSPGWGFVQLLR